MSKFLIEELGNVIKFQDQLISKAQQEQLIGKRGGWTKLLEIYIRQRSLIEENPYPEDDEARDGDANPTSIKHLQHYVNPDFEGKLFRWGLGQYPVGNFRVIFAVHDFYKVLLLYAFDKKYNGAIRRADIEEAEEVYSAYINHNPGRY